MRTVTRSEVIKREGRRRVIAAGENICGKAASLVIESKERIASSGSKGATSSRQRDRAVAMEGAEEISLKKDGREMTYAERKKDVTNFLKKGEEGDYFRKLVPQRKTD